MLQETTTKQQNAGSGQNTGADQNAHVELKGLTKDFDGTLAVDDLDLTIYRGSFTCLLGPSGCGKTTTLRMISGFVEPTRGEILISGISQRGVPPHRRNTSIVFQEYALFPHMTVGQNVAYGLKVHHVAKDELRTRVNRILDFMGLTGMEDRLPTSLSGGQQQRVALARSLVMEPEVLLMDEPLSNLDAKLRVKVRTELKDIQRRLGITTIYVTHDQEEALSMSDKIAVMDEGLLQQYGAPWELYFNPSNRFVADFIGANAFVTVRIESLSESEIRLAIGDQRIALPSTAVADKVDDRDKDAKLSLRPESITIRPAGDDGTRDERRTLRGTVKANQFLGAYVRYWVEVEGQEVIVDDHDPRFQGILEGDVALLLGESDAQLFPIER